ncbi:hypothetical protein [Nocardia coubleae]|nr:hypothetical protein [Nocardia coubleae]
MNNSTAILALILSLVAITAITVWWPNPADRQGRTAVDAEGTDK